MTKATARKAEKNQSQIELLHDVKKDLNPFWASSLFSDVYLKNDLPREYKTLWEDEEIGDFYNFYQGFVNLCHDLDHESFESWREADTVKNWIVPVMSLLGWENNSERHQNSYVDNTSFTVEEANRKQVYRPDLIYFNQPEHKSYTQKEKDSHAKLREVRDKKTGAKIVLEAKYWDRLSSATEKYKTKQADDSASGLGPELQTLKYMEIFNLDFGILTDGKTWRLYHKELSQGVDRRTYEFDLGNLKELALDLRSDINEQKFRNYAKYFFYFFSKKSMVQEDKGKSTPFLYEILEYSKKYAYSIEDDLKKRFIISMGLTCNALQKSAEEQGTKIDLDTIRNVAESHLFNILFTKSCEVRRILPIQSINYLKYSLHEVIEYLTEMKFDPDKNWDDYLRDFRYGDAFGGKKFNYEGYDIFNRFINLYEIIHDGTNKSKDFGFEIQGFKESIFSKEEWIFARKHKISNRDMISILFNLNFIESNSPDRKYQQIPYSYFTPRQLGSIYESFLEFRLEKASSDMVFTKGQWKEANLSSNHVRKLKLADEHSVRRGQLFFSPNNSDRKMSGSYYTPDFVVKYIVRSAMSPMIKRMTAQDILNVKVCDPAMGSGHFLAGAMDYLVEAYREKWAEEHNDDCPETIQETARSILDKCLFGVDLNPRAVKLAKLSLWLTTAQRGLKLERLSDQLYCGNSLTTFDWNRTFKKVFSNGGFDYVIGNPPYIKVQNLSDEDRDFFKNNFKTFTGACDIYIMFIEKSIQLLKAGGVVSYICPNSLKDADFSSKLRVELANYNVSEIVDFGTNQIFKGATTYTMIVNVKNENYSGSTLVKIFEDKCTNLEEKIHESGKETELNSDTWVISNLDSPALHISGVPTLTDYVEKIFVGLQITPSQVFGLKLVKEDSNYYYVTSRVNKEPFPVEKKYIRKLLKSSDIKKFKIKDSGNLVYFPYKLVGKKFKLIELSELKKCPKLYSYIEKNKDLMYARDGGKWEGRSDYYGYSRIQNVELNNYEKIAICGTSSEARFSKCSEQFFLDRGSYGIILNEKGREEESKLLAILNSSVLDNFVKAQNKPISGGYYPYQTKTLEHFPIPNDVISSISKNPKQEEIEKAYEDYLKKSTKRRAA